MQRDYVDSLFSAHFSAVFDAPIAPHNFNCMRIMAEGVELHCGKWSPYSMRYVRNLASYCDTKSPDELSHIYSRIGHYCSSV
mmetsp:Transcript_18179/g.21386  ORF Transcript_18179/g.21386 Transcript_18179/m.21386 type:complete len:82 (+) Transcript_18179:1037-1282(+)